MPTYNDMLEMWQSYNIKRESDIDLYLDNFRILFAYNSGKIENADITYRDTREIFENGRVQNFTGDPRTLFELRNQKMCYEFLKAPIVSKAPLTVELVKEVHQILTEGTYDERRFVELGERPGEFKKHDFVTGVEKVGSPPEDVESDMAGLLDELTEFEGRDVMKLAAYFHLRFEYIHPFAEGNGRVARTLMNYYLMTHDHPPIIIHEEDKALYYDALEQYDKQEKSELMYNFLLGQAVKTWDKTYRRSQKRGQQPEE